MQMVIRLPLASENPLNPPSLNQHVLVVPQERKRHWPQYPVSALFLRRVRWHRHPRLADSFPRNKTSQHDTMTVL